MVLGTTLITPPMLNRIAKQTPTGTYRVPGEDRPGDGGIDDLVAGARQDEQDGEDRTTKAIRPP
jgi:hypothetical protein